MLPVIVINGSEYKMRVVILSNVSSSHSKNENIDKLCNELMKQLFITTNKNNSSICEAPFLELAFFNGWGQIKMIVSIYWQNPVKA